MDRRRFLLTSLAGVFAAPLAAEAQQLSGKIARIGLLGDVPSFLNEEFRQGLRELGYVEGQSIVIEHRYPEWKYERLPGLAADLVRLKVDVIVAASRPLPRQPNRQPARSPLSSSSQATLLPTASSPAWPGPAATSPG